MYLCLFIYIWLCIYLKNYLSINPIYLYVYFFSFIIYVAFLVYSFLICNEFFYYVFLLLLLFYTFSLSSFIQFQRIRCQLIASQLVFDNGRILHIFATARVTTQSVFTFYSSYSLSLTQHLSLIFLLITLSGRTDILRLTQIKWLWRKLVDK